MKFRYLILLLVAVFLVACSSTSPEGTPAAGVDADQVVLEIVGLQQTRSLTMAELQAMSTTEGWGGTISSAGVISPPLPLKGVTVLELTELVGGLEPGMGVSIIAKDGYGMTMSYEQIIAGDYITYDPGTGDENQIEGSLQTIVAYERDGQPISPVDDGPLRLFVVSEKNDNIVDGHWSVKWVTRIELKPMSEEWSLNLEGAITEAMDRNSFESCSAPGCHQSSWEDEDGNIWTGVPLYYLAGRVDDGVRHEGRAYNDDFAAAGYTLQLFAADGYNVSIHSSRSDFNRHIFVASIVNGEPLDEKNFPLRLVGEDLEKSEMVGQLVQIVIQPDEGVAMPAGEAPVSETPAAAAALVLPEGAALLVTGQVMNRLVLGLENLQAMNVVDLQAEHPKRGLETYQGIRLNDLLNLAGAQAQATVLTVTASDGYSTELELVAVRDCADCLLAFAEDGTLSLVMPGMESNYWAKQVAFLEVR
ncbi:MAG: molybdopterin-dependent oxidoreductase [Anaerolineales bacterium]|nr:molybdopterin-dependent oxidoreductase [Anaerolineales bacterium]